MTRKRTRKSSKQGRSWQLPAESVRHAWGVVALVGLLTGVAYGLTALEPLALKRFQGTDASGELQHPTRLVWVDLPAWLQSERGDQLLAEIEHQAGLSPTADVWADNFCMETARRLEASPWVKRVVSLTRQADYVLTVEAEFRQVFTHIRIGRRAFAIDADGVRLPETHTSAYLENEPVGPLPIVGVRQPVPLVGGPWDGEDVLAGLTLARFLAQAELNDQLPLRPYLQAIDVSNFRARIAGPLYVRTRTPEVPLIWGKTPGLEAGTEPKADQKLHAFSTRESKDALLARLQRPSGGPIDLRDFNRVWLHSAPLNQP